MAEASLFNVKILKWVGSFHLRYLRACIVLALIIYMYVYIYLYLFLFYLFIIRGFTSVLHPMGYLDHIIEGANCVM